MNLSFGVPGGAWTATILGIALLIVCILEHQRLGGVPIVSRRRVLRSLRWCSALVAWLVAVQPTQTGPQMHESEGRVVLLIDDSRSMSIATNGQPRSSFVPELRERWERSSFVDVRRLAAEMSPVPAGEELTFEGGDSRIGDALQSLRSEGNVGLVVLVSDGAETGADFALDGDPLQRIITVPAGPREIRDDAIASLEADPIAFLRQPALIRVRVRRLGARGTIPVQLIHDGVVVQERVATVDDAGEGEVVFSFVPRALGRDVFRVAIPLAEEEAVSENNTRDLMVRVMRDRLRVLLVAGRPTWDVRFLRAFLERDPSIDLISFFILRTTADMANADPDELALIPFPTDELFREHLGSFDVIFFQDFDFEPYDMASYLPGIARYVERGGSFAMIGGIGSFGSGKYASTPLASVLPVEFDDVSRPERGVRSEHFAPQLADAFAQHPMIRLVDDVGANAALWSGLAPLAGVNRLRSAKENAQVLLRHPRDGTPVLASASVEEGRVIAFAADSSWRWGMTSAGETGDASVHARFWDRTLRWLARDPVLEPARITSDQERYSPGARMEIRGVLRDARYASLPRDQEITLEVRLDQDVVESRRIDLDAGDAFSLSIEAPQAPGVYHLVAHSPGGDLVKEPFVVDGSGVELADVRVRREYLAGIAEASGGETMEPDDLPSDPALLDRTQRTVRGSVRRAVFANPLLVTALVFLLGASWWTRRRWGES
ncbi:MAG: putative membrane protein [Polyangiales bacterium]|jgi:uncharacterized membrane protein